MEREEEDLSVMGCLIRELTELARLNFTPRMLLQRLGASMVEDETLLSILPNCIQTFIVDDLAAPE
jgi:hypothetical protein